MSHLIHPVETTLVSPARSVTPDLLDEWAVVDEGNLALAVAKAGVKKVEHKATQVVKAKKEVEVVKSAPVVKEGMAHVEVRAQFAGRLSELAAALTAHDLARAAGQDSTMSAQDALDNITALLHRQLKDSFASTSGESDFKRPTSIITEGAVAVRSAGPHHRAGGARERRWAEHEAVVTGKLDSVDGRLAEVRRQYDDTQVALVKLEQVHDEALQQLSARIDKHEQAAAEAAAKAEAGLVAEVGTVERTVNGLLDEVKADHNAAASALPYLSMLVNTPIGEGTPASVEEVARLIVNRALSSPFRSNSHARLCRDLAKQLSPSIKVAHPAGFFLTGPAAFHKLVNDRCLAAFPAAPNKLHAAAFVAELFVRGVATKQTVHAVLAQLLVQAGAGDDHAATAAYNVLARVGHKLDVAEDKALMDAHFARLKGAKVSLALWNKVGGLIELRNKGWGDESSALSVVSAASVNSIV